VAVERVEALLSRPAWQEIAFPSETAGGALALGLVACFVDRVLDGALGFTAPSSRWARMAITFALIRARVQSETTAPSDTRSSIARMKLATAKVVVNGDVGVPCAIPGRGQFQSPAFLRAPAGPSG